MCSAERRKASSSVPREHLYKIISTQTFVLINASISKIEHRLLVIRRFRIKVEVTKEKTNK